MSTTHIYLKNLHLDHKIWANELSFYKQEIGLLESHLGEVESNNTATEATAPAERFQNQFIRQREVLDELVHDIKSHESQLVQYAKDHPTAIDHVHFDSNSAKHKEMENHAETFKKLYKDLKSDFMQYLSKWM